MYIYKYIYIYIYFLESQTFCADLGGLFVLANKSCRSGANPNLITVYVMALVHAHMVSVRTLNSSKIKFGQTIRT